MGVFYFTPMVLWIVVELNASVHQLPSRLCLHGRIIFNKRVNIWVPICKGHGMNLLIMFVVTHLFSAPVGDGKCVICDSYVRPCTLVRICDECNYGSYQGRCVICGGPGVSDAYYCKECTIQEKDVSMQFILVLC